MIWSFLLKKSLHSWQKLPIIDVLPIFLWEYRAYVFIAHKSENWKSSIVYLHVSWKSNTAMSNILKKNLILFHICYIKFQCARSMSLTSGEFPFFKFASSPRISRCSPDFSCSFAGKILGVQGGSGKFDTGSICIGIEMCSEIDSGSGVWPGNKTTVNHFPDVEDMLSWIWITNFSRSFLAEWLTE